MGKLKDDIKNVFIKEENTKQREEIIDDFLVILKEIKQQETIQKSEKNNAKKINFNDGLKPNTDKNPFDKDNDDKDNNEDDDDEKKQRQLIRNGNDEMSSVSTHSSMPSLMSDDESDDDIDDELDLTDSDASDEAEIKGKKENIPHSSNEEEAKKSVKTKQKNVKNTKKNDDSNWLSGMNTGFLNNKKGKKKQTKKAPKKGKDVTQKNTKKEPPKKGKDVTLKPVKKEPTKREQLQAMGYTQDQIDRISLLLPPNWNIAQFIEHFDTQNMIIEEEEKRQFGYRLKPELDVNRNSNGSMFVCVGPRRVKARLKEYTYLECYVSFSQKLKKKTTNKPTYLATLLDLTHLKEFQLRDLERQKLKNSFENVLSFDLESNHLIIDVQKDGEREMSLKEAFDEYAERHNLKKVERKVAKLVTAGFEDEEARKALKMSLENKESEQKEDDDGNDNDENVQNAEEVVAESKIVSESKKVAQVDEKKK